MELFCTKKLADQLPVRMEEFGEREDASRRWSANIRTIGRRNALILTQEQTGFAVVLYGVTRRELNHFEAVVRQAIWDTLSAYGVKEAALRPYLPEEPITLRAARAENLRTLTRVTRRLLAMWEQESIPEPLQLPAVFRLNRSFQSPDKVGWGPADEMMDLLEELSRGEAVSQRSFLVQASLDLVQYTASREFLVPEEFTFQQLHGILQTLFQWSGKLDYVFVVPNDLNCCYIASQQESGLSGASGPVLWARTAVLGQFLRPGQTLTYGYDPRAKWGVKLEVLGSLDDLPAWGPVCTACDGISPPEELNSMEKFLRCLGTYNFPSHPEYKKAARLLD